MSNQEESFFKPVLSTLGLIVSFITVLTPLFPLSIVRDYFIDSKLAVPSSVLAVVIGLIVSWAVFSFPMFLELRIGSKKKGDYVYPRLVISTMQTIWLLATFLIILFYLFFSIKLALLQSIVYVVFFSVTIFIFSLLVSITKGRYEYLASKDTEAERIFKTLEKNRLITPGISIYSNEPVTQKEIQDLDIRHLGMVKKIRLETVVQKKEHIEVILSSDCRELIKVLAKKEVN